MNILIFSNIAALKSDISLAIIYLSVCLILLYAIIYVCCAQDFQF